MVATGLEVLDSIRVVHTSLLSFPVSGGDIGIVHETGTSWLVIPVNRVLSMRVPPNQTLTPFVTLTGQTLPSSKRSPKNLCLDIPSEFFFDSFLPLPSQPFRKLSIR